MNDQHDLLNSSWKHECWIGLDVKVGHELIFDGLVRWVNLAGIKGQIQEADTNVTLSSKTTCSTFTVLLRPGPSLVCFSTALLSISLHLHRGLKPHTVKHNRHSVSPYITELQPVGSHWSPTGAGDNPKLCICVNLLLTYVITHDFWTGWKL